MARRERPLTLTSATATYANAVGVAGVIAQWQVPDQVRWIVKNVQEIYMKLFTAAGVDIGADSVVVLATRRNDQQQLASEKAQVPYSAFGSLDFNQQHNNQVARLPKFRMEFPGGRTEGLIAARHYIVLALNSADVIDPSKCEINIPLWEEDV